MAKKTKSLPADLTAFEVLGRTEVRDDVEDAHEDPAALAGILIHDALTPDQHRRLIKADGIALVVQVPSADWADPVTEALHALTFFQDTITRTGASRATDKPDNGNDRVARRLAGGLRVCGVSQAPEQYLPATLVASADIRLDLVAPTPVQIARAIRQVTGEEPQAVPAVHGLGYNDFLAAMRQGATAAECVARLRAASVSRSVSDPNLPDAPLLSDLRGYDDAKPWFTSLERDFRDWQNNLIPFSALDRSVLLSGEPGVGKTLLARSVAKTLGIPLFATSVSSWFSTTNGYLGDISRKIDEVFSAASAAAPSVLLLDEADALPSRSSIDSRNRDFWLPLITQFLLKLDGATSGAASKLIIIAATNHPEALDPALVRPGRLSRSIRIRRPDAEGLCGILRQHLGSDLPGADLAGVAALGLGSTGADVTAWVKGARREARVAGRPMMLADLVTQVAPPDDRSPEDLLACARHEMAHALSVEALSVGDVLTVTTVAAGSTVGLTRTRLANRSCMTRGQIDAYVVSTLCGRAADELFGEATTGAGGPAKSDLGLATAALAAAHVSLGLGGSLLHRAPDAEAVEQLRWDTDLRRDVQADLNRLYGVARAFVETHQAEIDALARRLVESRIIPGAVIRETLAENRRDGVAARAKGGRHG